MSPQKRKKTAALKLTLSTLRSAGALDAVDRQLARAIARLSDDSSLELLLATALASNMASRKHVCVKLGEKQDEPITDGEGQPVGDLRWPKLAPWRKALEQSPAVETLLEADGPLASLPQQPEPGQPFAVPALRPLVLDLDNRLYLRRLWEAQGRLAALVEGRVTAPSLAVDGAVASEGLARLFSEHSTSPDAHDYGQRLAALIALLRPFCIITGGPGTGKTYTVARLLALLVEQARAKDPEADPPVVQLVAPTGKAAARLADSIKEAKLGLNCSDATRDAIPEQASTIHRALKIGGGRDTPWAHSAKNPLAADLVLVDEASLVDLSLMTLLVEATPPTARLVLLGDREQLTSIEAGAILGDLCNPNRDVATPVYSKALRTDLKEIDAIELLRKKKGAPKTPTKHGIWDSIGALSHSFRFAAAGNIDSLAKAISRGKADDALALLTDKSQTDVNLLPQLPEAAEASFAATAAARERLVDQIVAGLEPFLTATEPNDRLEALNHYRVLCAHRQGFWGSTGLNAAVEEQLEALGHIQRKGPLYDGRPIMVTTNNYDLKLWNGDVGLLVPDTDTHGETENPDPTAPPSLVARFANPDGTSRRFAPSRLPPHETVFAMSVHKSQGSEFDHVLVVLPANISRVLSRELLYTAVTRAKKSVTICASPEVIKETIGRQVERASGLTELLWSDRA